MLGEPREHPDNPPGNPVQKNRENHGQAISDEQEVQKRRAKLHHLLVEGSLVAMREVFNTIHPPISLHTRLARVQALRALQKLRQTGALSKQQWDILYPKDKKPNSKKFDNILLHLLLQHVCHLSPPYPNGWDAAPLVNDTSIAANLVRLDNIRHLIYVKDVIEHCDLYTCFEQITEILCNLNGPGMRTLAESVFQTEVPEQQQVALVEYIDCWDRTMQFNIKNTSIDSLDFAQSQLSSGLKLPKIETSFVSSTDTLRTTSATERQRTPSSLHVSMAEREGSRTGSRAGGHAGSRRSSIKNPVSDFLAQDRNILSEHYKLLVDHVRSDIVLPRLVKAGILTHEEKNNINLATLNADRMKALLRILPTKQQVAFVIFCESIKQKNESIYDSLMTAKRLAMERPDDVTEANANLRSSYKSSMSQVTPVPWHPDAKIDIRDFYTPLYISDRFGRDWTPESILQLMSQPKQSQGQRVVLEGESGSGKSTICRYITTEWAHQALSMASKFRLVYYIEVKLLKKNLAETILEHCYDAGFKKSPEEVYKLIESFQKDVMFILDGLEDLAPKVTEEVMNLLKGTLFPESCVLVAMNSTYVTSSVLKICNARLAVMGLAPYTQDEFIMRYARLTKTTDETYTHLQEAINCRDEANLKVLSQKPQLLMCLCLLCETELPLEADTTTALLQTFFLGLQKLYCTKHKIRVIGNEMPEKMQIMAQDMEENAWRCMHQNGSFYIYDQSECGEANPMFTLGILQCRVSSALPNLQQLFFTNRIFQDFMVARVLCRLDPEDFNEYVDSLVNDRYYFNVTQYLCGLLKEDMDTKRLHSIINGLASANIEHWSGFSTNANQEHGANGPITEGCLGDFILSLACTHECEGREDMIGIVIDSIPVRLFTKHEKMLTHGAIMGLNHLLKHPESMLVELEVRLDHFSRYYSQTLAMLANAIHQSQTLSRVQFNWTDSDLLTEVFAIVFKSECNIQHIGCVDRTRTRKYHHVSAGVWANMRKAGNNMASVQSFFFADCHSKVLVSCILQSLPYTIRNLSVSNATIDMVSAQALAKRVENSSSLQTLDLTTISIGRADFSSICSGLRLCGSLQELNLTNTTLDAISFVALSEALKFNRSLKAMNISQTSVSYSACKALALALQHCRNMSQVVIRNTTMTQAGKHFLHTHKGNIILTGMETVNVLPESNSRLMTDLVHLDLPIIY